MLTAFSIARRSGVSSLLPPNDDIPLSFSMISISGSESIKSSTFTESTFAIFHTTYLYVALRYVWKNGCILGNTLCCILRAQLDLFVILSNRSDKVISQKTGIEKM